MLLCDKNLNILCLLFLPLCLLKVLYRLGLLQFTWCFDSPSLVLSLAMMRCPSSITIAISVTAAHLSLASYIASSVLSCSGSYFVLSQAFMIESPIRENKDDHYFKQFFQFWKIIFDNEILSSNSEGVRNFEHISILEGCFVVELSCFEPLLSNWALLPWTVPVRYKFIEGILLNICIWKL